MMTHFEKRFSVKGTFRIVCALIYILSIFAFPLTHSCTSTRGGRSYCHSSVIEFCGEVEAGCRDQDGSGHDDYDDEPSSGENSCAACIHSVNSKTPEVGRGNVLVTFESSTLSGPALISQSLKHTEWTTSIFLRGPPVNIS
jgi:hypothetical protein